MNSNISKSKMIILTMGILTILSGCASKNAPDEFMVLRKAPLFMPPDYYLTPGGPTDDLEDVVVPQEIAKRALFGAN